MLLYDEQRPLPTLSEKWRHIGWRHLWWVIVPFRSLVGRTWGHRVVDQYQFACKVHNESVEVQQLHELLVSECPNHQCHWNESSIQWRHHYVMAGVTYLYEMSGFSSALNIVMDESASGGRTSTSALECLCKATELDGFKSSRSIVDKILKIGGHLRS